MRPVRAPLLLALCLSLLPGILWSQAAPSRDRILEAAREVMRGARYATLATLGPDSAPQARIVDPMLAEDGLTIWVGTNPRSRKVEEISRDPRVTLLFFDATALAYVTVRGRAEVVVDSTERARAWKAEWAPFYRNGYLGDDFLLLRVRVALFEVVSPSHGLVNDPDTWRPVILSIP